MLRVESRPSEALGIGAEKNWDLLVVADGKLAKDPTAGLKVAAKGEAPLREVVPLTPEELRCLLAATIEPTLLRFEYGNRASAVQTLHPGPSEWPECLFTSLSIAILPLALALSK